MKPIAKVLIAEDELLVAQDLAGLLGRLGYEVIGIAESGPEAIALAREASPDLALMDIRLSGAMDGIEAAARIRDESHAAVIYLTGNSERATRDRAKSTEPFAYLLKPFDERSVEMYLDMALAKHRAERKLRAAQAELRRQERLATLGKLAGSVAHEMRTPLTVMQNSVAYLEMTLPKDTPAVKEVLAEATRAIANCDHIIKEMLDYVREVPPSRSVFLLAAAAGNALKQVQVPAAVKVRGLEQLAASQVHGNEDQVTRILINLFQNAFQAMPDGGMLALQVETGADGICLAVSDTGCGIPAEHLDLIFEPLFSTKVRGIGLGLAIAHRYAELNGGSLTVESEVGRGTTFRLVLPRPSRAC